MAKYIILGNWTDKGAANAKETTARSKAAREEFAKVGVSAREWFFTMGPYDVVLTCEAPDDETMTLASLALSAKGNMRTMTLRAFGEKEIDDIAKRLG